MHLGDCLGGYNFFEKNYETTLSEPRFIDRGEVTANVFAPDSRILEINSKSGLYPLYMAYAMLALAIITEVTGSTFLVKSEGFTKLWPSLAVVVLFSIAFYLLSQVIKVIPLGIAYAIWAGVGIILTAIVGYFIFKQNLDIPAMLGIGLIVSGVLVINLFSNSTGH